MTAAMTRSAEVVDYDLHGVVGIRLLEARPDDVRAVARQLGLIAQTLKREPDIVIRFVDDLRLTSDLRYLGADESAFTDDAFLVIQNRKATRTRSRIPLEQIGGRCEIVCESGAPAVPLLIAIINLTAIAKGVIPLHASAFLHRGVGVLVTGWSKGGKTEALLAFMAKGAEYVGDEWIYLAENSKEMFGIPQPIRVWDWHLKQFPEYRRRIGRASSLRLQAIRAGLGITRAMASSGRSPGGLDRVLRLARRQAYVDIAPEKIFGPYGGLRAPIDRVFLLGSGATPEVEIAPIAPLVVADRMVSSVRYEFQRLLSHYLMFKFAFPSATNARIETLEQDLQATLPRRLEGKPAFAVDHPYPMSIPRLYDVMSPHI